MIDFLKHLDDYFRTKSDSVALSDTGTGRTMTYGDLDLFSGRVYAFLKERRISENDIVLVKTPRSIESLAVMTGIFKAGATCVMLEADYPKQYMDDIFNDCKPKLVIDSETICEILNYKKEDGRTAVNPDQFALIIYTSGSTGKPKGVRHSYKILDTVSETERDYIQNTNVLGCSIPLYFVAAPMTIIPMLYFGKQIVVIDREKSRNIKKLKEVYERYHVDFVFLLPSLLKRHPELAGGQKTIFAGGEPLRDLYIPDVALYNCYSQTEYVHPVLSRVDKSYPNTPIGRIDNSNLRIEYESEKQGELCVRLSSNSSYVGLPVLNQQVYQNGYLHTGDMASVDEDGYITIIGRIDDMVKINGNRVEPGEIEAVANKVLNLKWSAARVFDDGQKAFICVYYLEKRKIDFEEARKAMAAYLPYYMLPSFFIHIDRIPLTASGKLDRKSLPGPVFETYKKDYVEPADDIERAICEAFEKVLKRQNIGIKDDFYQLGGDSLSSVEAVCECNLPGLSATDIFKGHTPERIAELYRENTIDADNPDDVNEASKKHPHPLTPEQQYMINYQSYTPDSTMYNLYSMAKLDKNVIDMQRLTNAVNQTLANYPALLTEFYYNEDGEINQKYSEDNSFTVQLEKVSEGDLAEIKKTLVQPFNVIHSRLIRIRAFETEEAGYLFMDVHHVICDGSSLRLFRTGICTAYNGQELPGDYYYYILHQREKLIDTEFYAESRKYFEDRYSGRDWCRHPSTDMSSGENKANAVFITLPVDEARLDAIKNRFGISRNVFFITVTIIANAVYENKNDILVSWIYNGRNDTYEMASVGLLYKDLPIGVSLKGKTTLERLYNDVMEQVNSGITFSCCPYIEYDCDVVDDDVTCVFYQDSMRNMDEIPGLLGECTLPDEKAASQNVMDLEILKKGKEMVLLINYAASLYRPESIDRYGKIYKATVAILADSINDGLLTFDRLKDRILNELVNGDGSH